MRSFHGLGEIIIISSWPGGLTLISRILFLTRYTILIPVIGAWLGSLIAMGLGGYEVVMTIIVLFTGMDEKGLKALLLNLVEGVDLFLLGTAFYLIALGL